MDLRPSAPLDEAREAWGSLGVSHLGNCKARPDMPRPRSRLKECASRTVLLGLSFLCCEPLVGLLLLHQPLSLAKFACPLGLTSWMR